jgi:hypothetical protein
VEAPKNAAPLSEQGDASCNVERAHFSLSGLPYHIVKIFLEIVALCREALLEA